MMWTSPMAEVDLSSVWTVLATEALTADAGIEAVPTGIEVMAGPVLAGVDSMSRRHLLIPLRPGEAFADDRRGRAVHLLLIDHAGVAYQSAVCLRHDLDRVFTQFASELLDELAGADTGAAVTVAALDQWRALFSDASRAGTLTEPQLIGLLAELHTLRHVLEQDDQRRVEVWTGPTGSQHDLRSGSHSIEVKATLVREGRVVGISSVDQLDPPVGGDLHLVHHQFATDPDGECLPDVVQRILDLGVVAKAFRGLLAESGYIDTDSENYRDRRYRLVERRVYDVEAPAFPRIIPSSFSSGGLPPGTLRLRYSIDLSNEPPIPLDEAETMLVMRRIGTDS